MKMKKLIAFPLAISILSLGIIGTANAQTAPRVALQFATSGLTSPLSASSSNATIARLLLDTTGSSEAVRILSLPFNLIVGGGGIASTLTNCQVYNESSNSTSLNPNSTVTFSSGVNQLNLANPLILPANTMTTLALRCDVSGNLVSGSTYTINMNTSNMVATGATTGTAAIVTVRGAVAYPTPTTYTYPTPSTTPGVPSTGAGGALAQNLILLATSLSLAFLGYTFLSVKKRTS